MHLLVIILAFLVDDVEESELVDTLARGDHSEPVTELLLLEELLGPITLSLALLPHHQYTCLRATYKYFK